LPLVESRFNVGLLPIAWQRRGQIEITMPGKILSDGKAGSPARMSPAELERGGGTHAWLELEGILIDISSDQLERRSRV
jgi:hypothetical protein